VVPGNLIAGESANLEEVRITIEEHLDALSGQELAALAMTLGVLFAASSSGFAEGTVKSLEGLLVFSDIVLERVAIAIDVGPKNWKWVH
jgi:hypothetical protein